MNGIGALETSRPIGDRTDPIDPIDEAQAQWRTRYPDEPEQALRVGVITSVMRVQQLLLARVELELRPFGLTFASYEALQLLAFCRRGALPLGLMGRRLMVHPATITNTIDRLEQRGLVRREVDPEDGRRRTARLTDEGRTMVGEATRTLHDIGFGLVGIDEAVLASLVDGLGRVRMEAGDWGRD